MNQYVNLLDSESLIDVAPYTKAEHRAYKEGSYTVNHASLKDIEHSDKWQYPQFNYHYNSYGFRDNDVVPKNTDIAAYGCSFTMGLGLPEYMLWHKLLAKELNMSSLNFGLSGASAQTVFDLFLITTKHIKVKHAIILSPSHNRMQIAVTHPYRNNITYLSMVPNLRSELARYHGVDSEMLYKYVPEEERIKLFINQVYLIDYISKDRNIKLYLSSWDRSTYDILLSLKLKNTVILPDWRSESQEQAETDLARDRLHPGPIHHQQWVDKIKELIK